MFRELHEIAKRGALQMMLVAEDGQLRVTLAQKKAAGAAPLNLSILATPDELDAELPTAIETAASTPKAGKPVADQVGEQVAQAVAGKEAKKAASKPAAKAKTVRPAKPVKKAAPPKPKKAAKAPKVKLPGASKPAKSAKPAAVKRQSSRPDKPACIADYQAMKAQHGDKLTRELFIEKSETGRRFERLWGMSWRKFVAAAVKGTVPRTAESMQGSPGKGERLRTTGDEDLGPIRDDDTGDLFAGKDNAAAPASNTEADVQGSTSSTGPAAVAPLPKSWPFPRPADLTRDLWPFSTRPKDLDLVTEEGDRDVYDHEDGAYLSSITTKPALGDRIMLINCQRPLAVVFVDGPRILVREDVPEGARPSGIATPPAEEHAGGRIYNQLPEPTTESAPAQHAGTETSPAESPAARSADTDPGRVVRLDKGGRILAGGFVYQGADGLDIGTELEVPGCPGRYRVVEFTDTHINVEPVAAAEVTA